MLNRGHIWCRFNIHKHARTNMIDWSFILGMTPQNKWHMYTKNYDEYSRLYCCSSCGTTIPFSSPSTYCHTQCFLRTVGNLSSVKCFYIEIKTKTGNGYNPKCPNMLCEECSDSLLTLRELNANHDFSGKDAAVLFSTHRKLIVPRALKSYVFNFTPAPLITH